MKIRFQYIALLAFVTTFSLAYGRGSVNRKPIKYVPEMVSWLGEIKDEPSSHNTDHDHELRFVRKEDGEEFDIVDSPELVKLHHSTEKNYLVKVEAKKTPRFLYWGGNLVVKKFEVVEETSPAIPHHIVAVIPTTRTFNDRR